MNRARILQSILAVVVLLGTTSTGSSDEKLPILRLGNQDRCDADFPDDRPQECSPYPVPPLYLPRTLNTQVRPTPAENATPNQDASKAPPPVKAPKGEEDSAFAKPKDVDATFSEQEAERLDRLNSLLNSLQERLLKTVPSELPAVDATDTASVSDKPSEMVLPPPPPKEERLEDTEPPPPPVTVPETPVMPIPPPEATPIEASEPVSVTDPIDVPELRRPPEKPTTRRTHAWISQTAVDAPVDRLALADNLFAADETMTALSIYTEIDVSTLDPVDRHWVTMQLANCHRRIGNTEEAAKHYRMLVNVEEPGWIGEMSRWWLMVIDKQKSMSQQSEELRVLIQQLKEQVRADSRN